MDVLRHVYETLAPGGVMLDLRSVPPPSLVEVDGEAIGELDESEFFPRSEHNGDALAALAARRSAHPRRRGAARDPDRLSHRP